jgi:putative DNA primase/helicase
MASLSQIIDQMQACGLPLMPAGHPVLDGKIHRFGPKKKAWYALREVPLNAGGSIIGGAFGIWQGTSNNAVPVTIDWKGVSPEERAAAEQKQREFEAREREKKQRLAQNAANRAKQQWSAGTESGASPYLERKRVTPESVRFGDDGTLLVPMVHYTPTGPVLAGLQKIAADGSKRFNAGMDKNGTACKLGKIPNNPQVIGLAEGYATGRSVRIAAQESIPVVIGFDAGNLVHVARLLRAAYPQAHLLFFADDDFRLEQRFRDWLAEDFKVSAAVPVDGAEHVVRVDDGAQVRILASWRNDKCGVPYIDTDVRSGRSVRTPRFENAGISKAKAAAKEVGNASVVWPTFADRSDQAWTDFNDLHVAESLQAVTEQVTTAIARAMAPVEVADSDVLHDTIDLPPTPTDEWAESKLARIVKPSIEILLQHYALVYGTTDVWDELNRQKIKKAAFASTVGRELASTWLEHPDRRTIDPRSLPVLRGGRAIDGGEGGGDRLIEMLDKLTLLYGTETVWDSDKRVVMSLGAVRAAYGPDMVKRWQEDVRRKMIDADNLVFDPTLKVDPKTHINMFAGYPLVPEDNEEKCMAVLDLLFDLCAGEENSQEIGDWLLKWLAYPLQHPGAKMQTAVLMFGEKQGTGKSLFFEGIMRPIYGEYGGTAGQHQLDSSFTAWKSRKTYMVFEEVLSREDRYSHIGTLKHMITGRDMRINQKNLPERVEANHLNSVFLSNESQPIPIELEDRRFLVVEARNKLSQERVNQMRKQMDEGVSAAFYHFLLKYPLGDFNPHTKPIMTEAKGKIIRYGRAGWDAFHETWKTGDLAAPYCSCLSEDLYRVYERWCDRTHERKLSLTKFSELLGGREVKERKRVTMGAKTMQRTVFIIADPEHPDEDLGKQCQRFRDLAGIKEGE